MKIPMEKIEPQKDYERLKDFKPGQPVEFHGQRYTVERRTTLASGEPAVVLQSQRKQFVIGASQFLAGAKSLE